MATLKATNSTRLHVNEQRPLLRLTRPGEGQYVWIHRGKQGSLQTAYYMARLVREDAVRDEGLQRFAAQMLINRGLDSHSSKRLTASALCDYVQGLAYIHDPAGSVDAVGSARDTISKGFGDCDDLAVLLATLLALVGFEPRFVLARLKSKGKGYDHVYVDVILPDGRMALDPCSRVHGPGWESSRFYERLIYPIFAFPVTALGDAMSLVATGASIGLNFVPGVGPILSAIVGPVMGLFSRKQQRAEEKARDEYKDQVLQAMDQIRAAVDDCKITREQGVAAARQLIQEFYKACDQFTKKSVAASCRNFEDEDYSGGPQEGAFKTRTTRIQEAGSRCALKASSSSAGGLGPAGSVPSWALAAAAAVAMIFLIRR